MTNVEDIKIADFDYPLPDERIAKHPIAQRDKCKMLVRNAAGEISHRIFSELPSLIPQGSMLFCNNTRVINARMRFRKSTGATIEIFCLEPISPVDYAQMFQSTGSCRWSCLIGNLKRWKESQLVKTIILPSSNKELTLTAKRVAPHGNAWEVEFSWDDDQATFASVIEAAGYIPIPPYLNRNSEATDSVDYQTVYSKIKGSVAAPTAGLHFTDEVISQIKEKGIGVRELTLHVGAGTFQPVKSDTIGGHPMHTEIFSVERSAIEDVLRQLRDDKHIIAVGTTTVRTLESLPYLGALIIENENIAVSEMHVDQWYPYQKRFADFSAVEALERLMKWMEVRGHDKLTASTSIMIAPGFKWRVVDGIVTNFHQPQSTLLLLVSSFIDRNSEKTGEQWKKMYAEALDADYRFLSYGDSSYLTTW